MAPRVSSYMTRSVVTVMPNDTLAHARKLMLRNGISRLVVVEEEKPVGMVTITDIVNALMNKFVSRPLDSILVGEVMSTDLKVIESTKSVKSAALYMLKYKIGGLPVVDKFGVLVGIITRTDILKAYYERYQGVFSVGDVMRKDVAVGSPEHHIFYIARLAQADPAGKVVIVDENRRPIGIITKRDLAFASIPPKAAMAGGKDRFARIKVRDMYRDKIVSLRLYSVPVASDIMTTNIETAKPDEDLAEAAQRMYEERIGALPVVGEEGELVGIVTKIEVLTAIVRA